MGDGIIIRWNINSDAIGDSQDAWDSDIVDIMGLPFTGILLWTLWHIDGRYRREY